MERFFSSWKSYPFAFVSEDVRERHKRITSTPRQAVVLTELRELAGQYYDVDQLDCIPRSKYRPGMLLSPCRKYESGGKMPAIHWKSYYVAERNVRRLLSRKQKVTPLDVSEVPFDGGKNSGLPYLQKKNEVYEISLKRAKDCEQGACPPPMVMFSRGKNLDVVRPVMAGPFEWQLLEGKFFYPLQEQFLSFDNPYLVGRHSCSVAARLNELTFSPYVMCMDYSGFDGSLSAVLINSAFGILKGNLSLTAQEEDQFRRVVAYFITSPILCPDQRVYHGRRHGVPSGSMFTQMVDSICNMIIIEYVAQRLMLDLGKYFVVGDDSVVAVNCSVDFDTVIRTAGEIGITVGRKSQLVETSSTDSVRFLGHTYETGLPSRPVEETLTRLLTPEKIDRRIFSKDYATRKQYYLERIRAYQEDNASSDAWRVLRCMEVALLFPNAMKTIIRLQAAARDRHAFQPTEQVERDRWDTARKQLRSDWSRRWVRAAVFWA